jgi:hypothetical protein
MILLEVVIKSNTRFIDFWKSHFIIVLGYFFSDILFLLQRNWM